MTAAIRTSQSLLVLLVLAGCASTASQQTPAPEAALTAQEQMFGAMSAGQALEDTLSLIADFTTGFFENVDDGVVHHYAEATYPETRTRLGVYFQDKRLVALIIHNDVDYFRACRVGRPDRHWLANGMARYAEWLQARNVLGTSFDKRAYHDPTVSSESAGVADYLVAATYTPLVAVALYGYTVDRLWGGHLRDARRNRERDYLERTAPTVGLGVSEDELLSLMGGYDSREDIGETRIITYSQISFAYGFKENRLISKESPIVAARGSHVASYCPVSSR